MRAFILFCFFSFSSVFASAAFEAAIKAYNQNKLEQAVLGFKALCVKDEAKACFMLGLIFEKGKINMAKKYYKKACKYSLSSACINLALILEKEKNYENELYYDKACRLKNAKSCLKLGLVFKKEGDGKLANRYLKAACFYREKRACFALGAMLEKGEIIAQNSKKALYFYKEACRLKQPKACFIAANAAYNEGDKEKSLSYLKLSCDLGFKRACASYRELKAQLEQNGF